VELAPRPEERQRGAAERGDPGQLRRDVPELARRRPGARAIRRARAVPGALVGGVHARRRRSVERERDEVVEDEDAGGRGDDGRVDRAADAWGAAGHAEAVLAAREREDDAED